MGERPVTATHRPTELQCETTIIAAARRAGWLVHGERTVRIGTAARAYATPVKGDPGFPDLILTHKVMPIAAAIELKRRPNRVEPQQQVWHDRLRAAGWDIRVWWVPEDLRACLDYIASPDTAPRATVQREGGRWRAEIHTADGVASRTCPTPAPLIAWVERWADARNITVPINLAPVGDAA